MGGLGEVYGTGPPLGQGSFSLGRRLPLGKAAPTVKGRTGGTYQAGLSSAGCSDHSAQHSTGLTARGPRGPVCLARCSLERERGRRGLLGHPQPRGAGLGLTSLGWRQGKAACLAPGNQGDSGIPHPARLSQEPTLHPSPGGPSQSSQAPEPCCPETLVPLVPRQGGRPSLLG